MQAARNRMQGLSEKERAAALERLESARPGQTLQETKTKRSRRTGRAAGLSAKKTEEKGMEETIKIKYHSQEIEKLRYIEGKSDWIDLRVAENVSLKRGEYRLISMGISVQIPAGYEMLIAPRSSTFKNFGLLQTNSLGVVDESYCGDNDIIRMPVYATRDTELRVNDRIGQFRLLRHQPEIRFQEVESLGNEDRGGFGTTGIR